MPRQLPESGRLDQRIRIEVPAAPAVDAYGAESPAWSTLATVWASVRPLSGREALAAAQRRPEATVALSFRHATALAGLTASARAVHRGRVLEFLEVSDPDSARAEFRVLAVELVP